MSFRCDTLRLDGELMLPVGDAIAWREWASWRAGRTRRVLVKRLNGAALCDGFAGTAPCVQEPTCAA
jgi:phosphoribosyl-dephospho-CoA transferase